MSFFDDVRKLLRENIRDYGMFIALFVIMAFFTVATEGLFISPRNIVNLVNQTGFIAVLAVGMTLVIVIRHIDLSVGFLAGPTCDRGYTICTVFRHSSRASYIFYGS
jgi:putative multiple sugar transport system permease protein